MERIEFGYSESVVGKSTRGKGKKRKWREIESLKDKYRLKKELQELDLLFDARLEELEI